MIVTRLGVGAQRLGRAVRELPATWRGSLQLRVVSATMVLSIAIALLLGWLLNAQIRDGLVKAKEASSLSVASNGMNQARLLIAQKAASVPPAAGTAGTVSSEGNLWIARMREILSNLCGGAS